MAKSNSNEEFAKNLQKDFDIVFSEPEEVQTLAGINSVIKSFKESKDSFMDLIKKLVGNSNASSNTTHQAPQDQHILQ